MDKSIILEDFKKALVRFEEALAEDNDRDLEKAGCIQYFEFCFELAWKSIKVVAEELGLSDCLSPRAALKCAFGQGWLDDEALWLDMLACRNKMAHTYEAESALDVYRKLGAYVPALKALLSKLQK